MRKLTLAIIMMMVFASSAFAATSSPCGVKQPQAPRVFVDNGHRRDVLDNRVPVQTRESGTDSMLQATKDRETLLSGRN